MSVLVKVCSETLPTGEIVLARAVATLVLSYALVKRAGLSPWGNERNRLLLRGALGFSALVCALAVWRHQANIVRLMNGTESRFGKK